MVKNYKDLLNKSILFTLLVVIIVGVFPRASSFKYEIQPSKPWQYGTLLAPFDFAIKKSQSEFEIEINEIKKKSTKFLLRENDIYNLSIENFDNYFSKYSSNVNLNSSIVTVRIQIGEFFEIGIIEDEFINQNESYKFFTDRNEKDVDINSFYSTTEARKTIDNFLQINSSFTYDEIIFIKSLIKPNIFIDEKLTNNVINDAIKKINPVKDFIRKGTRIIAEGEIVKEDKLNMLNQLKLEYASRTWNNSSKPLIIFGYTILVSIPLLLSFLFLKRLRFKVFNNNKRLAFIFIMSLLIILLTKFINGLNIQYVYAIPLCILPLIIKSFFDKIVAFVSVIITLLIISFMVPNSHEFVYLNMVTGIFASLTSDDLYRRAKLFTSVGIIYLLYIFSYLAFVLISDGNFTNFNLEILLMFTLNCFATLFVQPLTYIFEKLFGLVSDASLLELTDTNNKILRELENKAPGTFHHSLQVANLAETAANAVGANTLLTRVGALYHDIGKIKNPVFFSENQSNYNPHDNLEPVESKDIIIEHVKNGVLLAKKFNLPERIIDFIKSHHGTTTVLYFFHKQSLINKNVKIETFKYPGPKPHSKETSIVMIADGVEAASKSLKSPNLENIKQLVDKVTSRLMEENQFIDATITLKDIQIVKKVITDKLVSSFQLRVEYPENNENKSNMLK